MTLPEKRDEESDKAYAALVDYCQLGAGRSLAVLLNRYQSASKARPPTKRLATLKEWSATYQWQERVGQYDGAVQLELEAQARAYRATIMEEGFAIDHERVKVLKEMAALSLQEFNDPAKRWLPDKKMIGGGDNAMVVDFERYNHRLVEQTRGLFDDLAKETGGRKQRTEVTGANGGPIQTEDVSRISDAQRAELIIAFIDIVRTRSAEPASSG